MIRRKCEECTHDEERTAPDAKMYDAKFSDTYPAECNTCSLNQHFTDNFEAKPVVWPPTPGQDVWCIAANADVIERDYDPIWTFKWASCYPTEEHANKARLAIMEARGVKI